MRRPKQKVLVFTVLFAIIAILVVFYAWPNQAAAPAKQARPGTTNTSPAGSGFDKNKYSLDDAASLWVVVNKSRSLPSSYTPSGLRAPAVPLRLAADSPEMWLRPEAGTFLVKLFAAAKTDGFNLMLTSGYRSYAEQQTVYGNYVKTDGIAGADTYSARPGHSEHQTGLAADVEPRSRVCELDQCFGATPEGRWLAANCYKFGFVIRYPKDKQNITGYEYEPWHVRYVGTGLAAQLHKTGQTLEQYFGLPAAPDYSGSNFELNNP